MNLAEGFGPGYHQALHTCLVSYATIQISLFPCLLWWLPLLSGVISFFLCKKVKEWKIFAWETLFWLKNYLVLFIWPKKISLVLYFSMWLRPPMLSLAEKKSKLKQLLILVAPNVRWGGVGIQQSVEIYSNRTVKLKKNVTHCNNERSLCKQS